MSFDKQHVMGAAAEASVVERVARLLVEQRGCSPETLHQFEPSHEPWPVDETQQSLNWEMKPTTISLTRAWRKRVPDAEQIVALVTALEASSRQEERLREELAWYGEQARLARLIHSEGDPGRHALAADGGKRARAALSPPHAKDAADV